MAGGTVSERKFLAIWCETRKRRMCKTNVRICDVERVHGYKGIRADKPYNVEISEERGERVCVKQLVSLKGIPNHPSKVSIQGR